MKILATALIAAGLIAVAAQPNPTADQRQPESQSAWTAKAQPMLAQYLPGECCNDDFRGALPLWEAPVDADTTKP